MDIWAKLFESGSLVHDLEQFVVVVWPLSIIRYCHKSIDCHND